MTPAEWVNQMPLHFLPPPHQMATDHVAQYREIVRIVQQAVNEERERCAKIADAIEDSMAQAIADRIRANGASGSDR